MIVMSMFGHSCNEKLGRPGQKTRLQIAPRILCAFAATSLALMVAPAAAADDDKTSKTVTNSIQAATTDGLNINLSPSQSDINFDSSSVVSLSPSLRGAVIEMPSGSVGSRLFDLDVSSLSCRTGEENCFSRSDQLDLGYSRSLTTKIDGKLDIQLTPSASVRFNDESSSAVVGALVRIGDDLREDSDLKANTWYMFAGADAEAVTYAPGSISRIANGDIHLQDRIIVGDAQAGVGYRIGDADVSLGYFRREVTSFGREMDSNSISFREDAAALSFTWRR